MAQLGITLADGSFFPISDDQAPIRRRVVLATASDHQNQVRLRVLRRDESGDAVVGTVALEGITDIPEGQAELELVLALDDAGNVSAQLTDPVGGQYRSFSKNLSEVPPGGTFAADADDDADSLSAVERIADLDLDGTFDPAADLADVDSMFDDELEGGAEPEVAVGDDAAADDFDMPDFDSPDFGASDSAVTSLDEPDMEPPSLDTSDFGAPDFDTSDLDAPDFDTPEADFAGLEADLQDDQQSDDSAEGLDDELGGDLGADLDEMDFGSLDEPGEPDESGRAAAGPATGAVDDLELPDSLDEIDFGTDFQPKFDATADDDVPDLSMDTFGSDEQSAGDLGDLSLDEMDLDVSSDLQSLGATLAGAESADTPDEEPLSSEPAWAPEPVARGADARKTARPAKQRANVGDALVRPFRVMALVAVLVIGLSFIALAAYAVFLLLVSEPVPVLRASFPLVFLTRSIVPRPRRFLK